MILYNIISDFVILCIQLYAIVWMDGWMDGWMHACMHACMYVCMYIYIYIYVFISKSDCPLAHVETKPRPARPARPEAGWVRSHHRCLIHRADLSRSDGTASPVKSVEVFSSAFVISSCRSVSKFIIDHNS